MRLKKLKVSGFKSFVDPTPITVPADLVGIVGPNGCGKSNVIDAVRWVMGESSAKTLRGDNMTDVIFNGSAARKPVGKASVELLFHNDDGKIPESYANFAEIGIKRTLTRDGKSEYFINNTRARRKDIQDIFRGTGLGPRSYSIIEQGMVNRIIESKPEDLRGFVEEAAGISKYKDRRRETENRIRHTRENLDRVSDIVSELEKQLRRLQRQSQAAQRYKNLKEQEAQVQGELLFIRRVTFQELAIEQARVLATIENELQQTIASQRESEKNIESLRVESAERSERFGELQAKYYSVGAQITTLEQKIAYEQETRRKREEDLNKVNSSLGELDSERRQDLEKQTELNARIGELEHLRIDRTEDMNIAAENRSAAERENQEFLVEWEVFNQSGSDPRKTFDVQSSIIEQQTTQQEAARQRLDRLNRESSELKEQLEAANPLELQEQVAEHTQVVEETSGALKLVETTIAKTRSRLDETLDENAQLNQARHSSAARLHSLKEIQATALGEDDEEFQAWILRHNLGQAPRLVSSLTVEEGWQEAADAALGPFLSSIVLPGELTTSLTEASSGVDISLVQSGSGRKISNPKLLANYVTSGQAEISKLIGNIEVAETVEDALQRREKLSDGQVIVTRDGVIVGKNWARLQSSQTKNLGLIAREEEIRELGNQIDDLDRNIEDKTREIDGLRDELRKQESRRLQQAQLLTQANREHADLQNRLGQREARFTQLKARLDRFVTDCEEQMSVLERSEARITEANELKLEAESAVARFEIERESWIERRSLVATKLEESRVAHQRAREAKYQADTRWQVESTNLKSLDETIRRLEVRRLDMQNQSEQLSIDLNIVDSPEEPYKERLNELLEERAEAEGQVNISRQESERVDHSIQQLQQQVTRIERQVEQSRERLGQQKLKNQETALRLQDVIEQLRDGPFDLTAIEENISDEATEKEWRANLEEIGQKISRIGPVNLVAIDEFEEQSERKVNLDQQHADLCKALETLESVIRKIDRETRTRFKDTFDDLNKGFQAFFPKLFGGGSAILELTDNDYLTTGVTVMARPPGKRNSTIHLLSGGEKALTAVSLLFSLFQLNPAPFCILDEVDAPLDDANVERYCNALKTLSKTTQLMVITHNKITMEAADVLIGVTMNEPGVSRIVSVDIDEAVKMATS